MNLEETKLVRGFVKWLASADQPSAHPYKRIEKLRDVMNDAWAEKKDTSHRVAGEFMAKRTKEYLASLVDAYGKVSDVDDTEETS